MGYLIYESRSCSWANIDNIELRANINIPPILDCDCSYSSEKDSKTAIFTLKMDSVAILKYANVNGFKPVLNSEVEFNFREINGVSVAKLWHKSDLHPDRESYDILLDPTAKKMYVSLNYLN